MFDKQEFKLVSRVLRPFDEWLVVSQRANDQRQLSVKSKDDTLYLSAADFKEIPPAKLLEILKYTLALVGLKNAIHSACLVVHSKA